MWANAVAARLLGFETAGELSQRMSILSMLDETTRADPLAAEVRAMQGLTEGNAIWRRKDGAALSVAFASRPIRWSGADALVMAFTDVTNLAAAQKQTEHALARAQMAQSAYRDLLRAVSHHLRTPLHGMMGRIAMAREDEISPKARALSQASGSRIYYKASR